MLLCVGLWRGNVQSGTVLFWTFCPIWDRSESDQKIFSNLGGNRIFLLPPKKTHPKNSRSFHKILQNCNIL